MPELSTATWYKSSFSDVGGNCVEVARLSGGRNAIRDSKAPHHGTLILDHHQWTALRTTITRD